MTEFNTTQAVEVLDTLIRVDNAYRCLRDAVSQLRTAGTPTSEFMPSSRIDIALSTADDIGPRAVQAVNDALEAYNRVTIEVFEIEVPPGVIEVTEELSAKITRILEIAGKSYPEEKILAEIIAALAVNSAKINQALNAASSAAKIAEDLLPAIAKNISELQSAWKQAYAVYNSVHPGIERVKLIPKNQELGVKQARQAVTSSHECEHVTLARSDKDSHNFWKIRVGSKISILCDDCAAAVDYKTVWRVAYLLAMPEMTAAIMAMDQNPNRN